MKLVVAIVFYLGSYWHQWKEYPLMIPFLKSPTPTAFGELGHSTWLRRESPLEAMGTAAERLVRVTGQLTG